MSVKNGIRPVALLHNGDLFNDLLQVRLHRNLFNGHNLPRLFMMRLEHAAIRPAKGTVTQCISNCLVHDKLRQQHKMFAGTLRLEIKAIYNSLLEMLALNEVQQSKH